MPALDSAQNFQIPPCGRNDITNPLVIQPHLTALYYPVKIGLDLTRLVLPIVPHSTVAEVFYG